VTFEKTKIDGLYLVKPNIFGDERGKFVKTFHHETFQKEGLEVGFVESYYSISQKHVLRGLHFQTPPEEHVKLVYVPHGAIVDVVVDIRKGSPTYGEYVSQALNAENGYMFYIPKGCAHGFLSLEDNTNVTYMQTTMYAPNSDGGLRYNSFGFDWGVENPITSERDLTFDTLEVFDSPFVYGV
jgi:dTDP-4-dehydrorhamnose 3,5-epimerase